MQRLEPSQIAHDNQITSQYHSRALRRGLSAPAAARLALMRALANSDAAQLAQWLDAHPLAADDLAWLQRQGLTAFAHHGFKQAGLLERLPADIGEALRDVYWRATAAATVQDWTIERVLAALTEARVDFAWVKGGALAHTVYPVASVRQRGDLDLWVQPEQMAHAQAQLESLGFTARAKQQRPPALVRLTGGELQMYGDKSRLHLVELQTPIIRGEWIRRMTAVDHASVWQRRTPFDFGKQKVLTLSPEDTLIHLCIHQAVNHQFGNSWLRNLLDVHQVVGTYNLDWETLAVRARTWRVATVVWATLDMAQRLLATTVPPAAMGHLAPSPMRRRLLAALQLDRAVLELRTGGYHHFRFLLLVLLADRWRDFARLATRSIYPEAEWLRARYQLEQAQRPLWRLRLAHLWLLATAARA